MIQKDYIMRMIEQVTRLIAKALQRKSDDEYEEALSIIESASGSILGIDYTLFDALSSADCANLLGITKDPSTASIKCLIGARLLKTRADVLIEISNDSASGRAYYQKAIDLYRIGFAAIGYNELDLTGFYRDITEIANRFPDMLPKETMTNIKIKNI